MDTAVALRVDAIDVRAPQLPGLTPLQEQPAELAGRRLGLRERLERIARRGRRPRVDRPEQDRPVQHLEEHLAEVVELRRLDLEPGLLPQSSQVVVLSAEQLAPHLFAATLIDGDAPLLPATAEET